MIVFNLQTLYKVFPRSSRPQKTKSPNTCLKLLKGKSLGIQHDDHHHHHHYHRHRDTLHNARLTRAVPPVFVHAIKDPPSPLSAVSSGKKPARTAQTYPFRKAWVAGGEPLHFQPHKDPSKRRGLVRIRKGMPTRRRGSIENDPLRRPPSPDGRPLL